MIAQKKPTDKYQETLLQYYEEEIMGEAYFYGLIEFLGEKEKLSMLAKVEIHAARFVVPLLEKYELKSREKSFLKAQGKSQVKRHQFFSWNELIAYMIKRYPVYLDDFSALESMAPEEDLPYLKKLTEHEVAVIAFARQEQQGNIDSLLALKNYLDCALID